MRVCVCVCGGFVDLPEFLHCLATLVRQDLLRLCNTQKKSDTIAMSAKNGENESATLRDIVVGHGNGNCVLGKGCGDIVELARALERVGGDCGGQGPLPERGVWPPVAAALVCAGPCRCPEAPIRGTHYEGQLLTSRHRGCARGCLG